MNDNTLRSYIDQIIFMKYDHDRSCTLEINNQMQAMQAMQDINKLNGDIY